MSIRAMNWAMQQATGDPRAQCLLYVVADAASETGIAWPSAEWMAEKSQQSRATVYRRLTALQEMGLLVMLPRYIDENGKITKSAAPGRRRTSPEIRLQLGVTIAPREPDEDESAGEQGPPEPEGPQSQPETGVSHSGDRPVSLLRRGSSHCGDSKNPNLNQESPQSPPSPDDEAGLERFRATYPAHSNKPELVAALWQALSDQERQRAMRGAEGARVIRGAKHPRPVKSADNYLRNPDLWEEYARSAPPDMPKPSPLRFVAFGSDEWRGRAVRAAICGRAPPRPVAVEGQREAGMLIRGDPGGDVMALARYADEAGNVDVSTWPVVLKHANGSEGKVTPAYAAWAERIREWTGEKPEPVRIWVDADGCPVATAAEAAKRMIAGYEIATFVEGLRVPQEFPTAKSRGC